MTATARRPPRFDLTGDFDREDLNPDAGLNLRLGFTSYALDATFNPDFSQVESDSGQVTVNERFALFSPKNDRSFSRASSSWLTQTLVYTRRIVTPRPAPS